MTTLPTGEKLPDYDDQQPEGVDTGALYRWLVKHRPEHWGPDAPVVTHATEEVAQVRDVLAALQAVGDATLVKNGTYRLMRQDGTRIEQLAAWLANNGFADTLVEHNGDPAAAAVTLLAEFREEITF